MSSRRNLGAYYTPARFAKLLAKLVITEPDHRVIDPSFGGCAFIEACFETLSNLGCEHPQDNIFGCDVDPTAFEHLAKLKQPSNRANFDNEDFLNTCERISYDVIIGNPPYIKYDNLPEKAKIAAEKAIKRHNLKLVKPNYWAAFLLKSMSLISKNGNLLFILPQTLYTSEYGKSILEYLSNNFSSVSIYPISGKIFEGTDESVCVLVAEGFGLSTQKGIHINNEIKYNDIFKIHNNEKNKSNRLRTIDFLQKIAADNDFRKIKEISRVRIGTVTGDKRFFVMSKIKASELGLPTEYLVPIISDARDLDRMLKNKTVEELPVMLAIPNSYQAQSLYPVKALDDYLGSASLKTKNSYHAKSRKPWYSIKIIPPPAAIIKNVTVGEKIIYHNVHNLHCTNNLIGLHDVTIDLKLLSIISRSRVYQLYAHASTTNFGREANKSDPRHIKEIYVPLNNKIEKDLNSLIKEEVEVLPAMVDEIILKSIAISSKDMRYFRRLLAN